MSVLVPRGSEVRRSSPCPEAAARISSDDLVRLLVTDGAEVIGSDEHGGFVRVNQRLIFIRRATVVDMKDLRDALRAAEMGPGRFDVLVEKLRQPAPP